MAGAVGTDAESLPLSEHGLSLLAPVDEVRAVRRRRERPAEVGRYLLLGLGGLAAGTSAVLSWQLPADRFVALAILGFGLILVALGATVHLVLLRDRQRQPVEAHAWEEGIELILANGEVHGATWADPKLALDVFVQPARKGRIEERLLVWGMSRSIPPIDLSEAGLSRLLQNVVKHGLSLAEYRRGQRSIEPRAYEIRGRPADAAFVTGVAPPEAV